MNQNQDMESENGHDDVNKYKTKTALDDGVKLFYSMINDYNIDPNGDTFKILFNLCAQCNNMEMCLNLLRFMIKHCAQTVELSNDLIAAFISCCIGCDQGKLGMRFYEDMYLFGDNYQIKTGQTTGSNKWTEELKI